MQNAPLAGRKIQHFLYFTIIFMPSGCVSLTNTGKNVGMRNWALFEDRGHQETLHRMSKLPLRSECGALASMNLNRQ